MAPKRRRATRGEGEQLRAEIVAATKNLLTDAHADDVSIRAVADAVGVTPPSIYLHFADKNALLSAVVVDVFRELDDAMTAEAAEQTTPLATLRALGLAYVRFAVAHPEHYRLATMSTESKPNTAVDEVLGTSAFQHLHTTVLQCIDAGIFAGDDPLGITFDLWAAAHGIAGLLIAKPYLPWGDPEAFADRVLCAAAAGHAVAALLGKPAEPDDLVAWLATQRA